MPKDCSTLARLAACFLADEDGVTAIEYGLLAALIAVTCIVAWGATGDALVQVYEFWTDAVDAAIN